MIPVYPLFEQTTAHLRQYCTIFRHCTLLNMNCVSLYNEGFEFIEERNHPVSMLLLNVVR